MKQLYAAVGSSDGVRRHTLDEESPDVGVPDLDGVRRAFRNGLGIRWVMDAWGLDYETAKAVRHELIIAGQIVV